MLILLDYVYYAYDEFKPIANEGMVLHKGEKVHIIDWSEDNWWFVTKESSGLNGWVPANYLIEEEGYNEQKLIENKVSSLTVTDGKILDVLMSQLANTSFLLFRRQKYLHNMA